MNRNAPEEKKKVILDHVSGTIKPGQFLAIIGASGKFMILLLKNLSSQHIMSQSITSGRSICADKVIFIFMRF